MRILFTTLRGSGHLHPLVPIARAAVAAGHEVAIACSASFIPHVEQAGFRAFPTAQSARQGGRRAEYGSSVATPSF